MKTRIRIVIIWCLVIAWMMGIFYLSHQSSVQSGEISEAVAEKVYENVDLTPERFEYKKESWLIAHYEHFVRKLAHLCIYIALGGLLSIAVSQHIDKKRHVFVISSIIGIIYAVSDELHQYFIPGRSFLIKDILIDSFGVISGAIIVVLVMKFITNIRKRRKN